MLVSEREKNADRINRTASAISSTYSGMSSKRNAFMQLKKIQERQGTALADTSVPTRRRASAIFVSSTLPLALEYHFQYKFTAEVGQQQKDEPCQRPANGNSPTPAVELPPGQQGGEYAPGNEAEKRLVSKFQRLAKYFFRKNNTADKRQRKQYESNPDNAKQQRFHRQKRG